LNGSPFLFIIVAAPKLKIPQIDVSLINHKDNKPIRGSAMGRGVHPGEELGKIILGLTQQPPEVIDRLMKLVAK
jgi:hypothetical protein